MTSPNSILFLGTGTSVGIPMVGCTCKVCLSSDHKDNRLRTSALVRIQNKNIQIDIGPDFRYQMLRNNILDLTAILLTHDHRDHVAGLDDLRAFNFIHEKKYDIYANSETIEGVKAQFGFIFTNQLYKSKAQFELIDIEKYKPFEIENITIVPIEITHGTQSILGFRFNELTYITDASKIDAIALEKIKGTKILVLNALRETVHPTHFSLSQALEIIDIIKPEKTYLTHISHHLGLHLDISKKLPANVFLAYDQLEVSF